MEGSRGDTNQDIHEKKLKSLDLRHIWEMGRRGERVPVSLEALRQKVLVATHIVEREVTNFRRCVEVKPDIEPRKWLKSLQALLNENHNPEIDDYKSIEPLIKNHKNDEEEDSGLEGLLHLIDISKIFDYLAYSVNKQLVEAHENILQKYCLSFESEGRGLDITTLRDQENKIIKWNVQITNRIKTVNELLDRVDATRIPVVKYVSDFRNVLSLMDGACSAMLKVCSPMKHWVTADAAFARKVLENIKVVAQQRLHVKDRIRTNEYEKEKFGLKIKRGAWSVTHMERALNQIKQGRRHLRGIEAGYRQNLTKLEKTLQKKHQEAQGIRTRVGNRKENSMQAYEMATAQLEAIRTDMRKTDASINRMKEQISASSREQVEVDRKLAAAVEELKTELTQQETLITQRDIIEQTLRSLRGEMQHLEQQENALKRIREMKENADTVKRIYHYGHIPTNMDDDKDILGEAIQLTAADLGLEWQSLYKRLPFAPPRREDIRQNDIYEIDESTRKFPDYWGRQQAMKGLQLWRRLNQSASVRDLIHALRRMRKQSTARKIERQLLTTH